MEESNDFVRWLSREAARRLRPILGSDMTWDDHWDFKTHLEFIYQRQRWNIKGVRIGLGFGTERDLLLPAAKFWLGIVLPWPDNDKQEGDRRQISRQAREQLAEHWPLGTLEDPEDEWPLVQYVKFQAADDPYQWAETVLRKLSTLGEEISAHLDKFIAGRGR